MVTVPSVSSVRLHPRSPLTLAAASCAACWAFAAASCAALTHLERDPERFAPLLAAFDGFVAQQLELRTRDNAEPVPRTPRIPA